MSISQLTLKSSDEEPVRRFEVFTGSGRRREWSDEQKAQIAAESYEPGVKVCSVARRHGLTPQQLFTWRRLARKPLEAVPDVDVPMHRRPWMCPRRLWRKSRKRRAHRERSRATAQSNWS